MRLFLGCSLLFVALVASGCSTFGVYDNEFACPVGYNGRCISLPESYDLARTGKDGPEHDPAVQKKKVKDSATPRDASLQAEASTPSAHDTYKDSLYKRFNSLLREPTSPVVAPPKVMRVLLLPYKGDGNELFMLRHVYFFVDEPRWVLGDSLVAIEGD